jgi:type IV pilus assembly protein PilZ
MPDATLLDYVISDPVELNLSYMPFINDGGLFVPSAQAFSLGDRILVDLHLPGKKEPLRIEGKIIWITPSNALHHVIPGVGIQFSGINSQAVRTQIEAMLDTSVEIGGYTYGITEESKRQ